MSDRTGGSILATDLRYATSWRAVSSGDQHGVGCGQVEDLGSFPLSEERA